MDTETIVTTDHDEIRNWIEAHNGLPAIKDKRDNSRGVIDIVFSAHDKNPEFEIISWDEFFDTFDSLNMEFHFDPNEKEVNEAKEFSYSFITQGREGALSSDIDNETEMPEDDIPAENIIPSAPARNMPDGTHIQFI